MDIFPSEISKFKSTNLSSVTSITVYFISIWLYPNDKYKFFNSSILKPKTENDLQEAIIHCYKKDLPIEIVGAGTKNEIGKKFQSAKTLNMSNLSEKELYWFSFKEGEE